MSVTFGLTYSETTTNQWEVSCSCGSAAHESVFSTRDDAVFAAFVDNSANPSCGDEFCAAFPLTITLQDSSEFYEVNVSNLNARAILEVLGFVNDDDLVGTVSADDFLGRVLVAMMLNPADAGVPVTTDGSVINCGRTEGYMDGILMQLQTLAQYAANENHSISWS